MKNIIIALLTVLTLLAANGCKEKSASEKAADEIKEAADKAKEAVKDGVKKAGDAVEKAVDKIKESVK